MCSKFLQSEFIRAIKKLLHSSRVPTKLLAEIICLWRIFTFPGIIIKHPQQITQLFSFRFKNKC